MCDVIARVNRYTSVPRDDFSYLIGDVEKLEHVNSYAKLELDA